jgi:ribosomal protein L34E
MSIAFWRDGSERLKKGIKGLMKCVDCDRRLAGIEEMREKEEDAEEDEMLMLMMKREFWGGYQDLLIQDGTSKVL